SAGGDAVANADQRHRECLDGHARRPMTGERFPKTPGRGLSIEGEIGSLGRAPIPAQMFAFCSDLTKYQEISRQQWDILAPHMELGSCQRVCDLTFRQVWPRVRCTPLLNQPTPWPLRMKRLGFESSLGIRTS